MEKDFDRWNELAKELQAKNYVPAVRPGDIWWCSLGTNIGDEQDGKGELFERPVLVLEVFNRHLVKVVPLTSALKSSKYYIQISILDRRCSVISSQVRSVSPKRFSRLMHILDEAQFKEITRLLKDGNL